MFAQYCEGSQCLLALFLGCVIILSLIIDKISKWTLAGDVRPDYKFTIEPNYGHDFDQEWNEESWCPENEVGCKKNKDKLSLTMMDIGDLS